MSSKFSVGSWIILEKGKKRKDINGKIGAI